MIWITAIHRRPLGVPPSSSLRLRRRNNSRRHNLMSSFSAAALLCYTTSQSISASSALNIAVISGTTRTQGPPNPILGPRVVEFIQQGLQERGNTCTLIDPRDLAADDSLPLLEKPHFCYAKSQVPESLANLHAILEQADAYVCITPEYNHAPSPALLNVLNHFGSSVFSFKPSAIVSYSAGQWGGTRAAIALRPVLSELGCLPVSAMIHIPKVQEVLDANGNLVVEEDSNPEDTKPEWESYCARCFSQLEWWATAARQHKATDNPFDNSPKFSKSPSERNAP